MTVDNAIDNRYKMYSEYKDSGVEWLGEIPSSWQLSKIKYTAPFQVGWTPSTSKDSNFVGDNLWANISDLGPKTIHDTTKRISDIAAKESSMDITPAGSLLYSFKLSVGTVSFAGCDMYTNEAIASFTSLSKLPLSYLYYTLPQFVIKNASTNIYGARILNQELIRNAIVLEPSYKEAEKIANFLDHETAKIDILIEKQQRLIELLTEKRQAVISHAVTKGLNPDVPMKDSGVEWLGEIPEHWEVKEIKFQLKSLNSRRIPINSQDRGDREGIYRYYGASGVIDYIDDYIFDEPTVLVGEDGANLLSRSTPLAFSAHGKYWVNNHAHILEAKDGLADFWAEVIDIIDVTPIVTGSAQPKLTAEALSNLKIAFPPTVKERKEIESFIHSSKHKYGELIGYAKKAIQLMQERRTALISAAVTGKIDVRDWVKPE